MRLILANKYSMLIKSLCLYYLNRMIKLKMRSEKIEN